MTETEGCRDRSSWINKIPKKCGSSLENNSFVPKEQVEQEIKPKRPKVNLGRPKSVPWPH